jgi:hypothetical protein
MTADLDDLGLLDPDAVAEAISKASGRSPETGGDCRRTTTDDSPVRSSSKTSPTGVSGGVTPRPVDIASPAGRRPFAVVVRLGAAVILGLTAIVGCSGGASGASTPPATASATTPPTASSAAPTSAALCSAAGQFRAATAAIGAVDATKVGVEGVKAALQNLQSAGRDLVSAAGAQFGPDVDNLTTALGSLQDTLASLTDQTSLSTKFGALAASVGAVEQAAAPILNSARAGCPA